MASHDREAPAGDRGGARAPRAATICSTCSWSGSRRCSPRTSVRILLRIARTSGSTSSAPPPGSMARSPGCSVEIGDALEQVVLANRPVTLQELPESGGLDPMMAAAGVGSLMASPLVVKGRLAGVVEVAMRSPRPFTLEDESLLILMADRAGLAIEHARAYEREVSNVEMLQRSLLPDRLPEVKGIQMAAALHARRCGRGRRLVRRHSARRRPGGRGDGRRGRPRHRSRLADGPAAPRHARVRARGPFARRSSRPARPPGAQPRRRPDGNAALPGRGARSRQHPLRQRRSRAAARDRPGRRCAVPRERAEPAARRVRERRPRRALREADARIHGGALHGWTGGGARCLDRPGPRGPAAGSGPGHLPPGGAVRPAAWRPCSPSIPRTTTSRCWRCARSRRRRHHFTSSCPPTRTSSARCGASSASWLRSAGASSEVVEIVQIACHEACSNSIEHGYSFGNGKLSVDAELDQRVVILTIRDTGGWVERPDGNLRLPRQRPADDGGTDGLGGVARTETGRGRRCGWHARCRCRRRPTESPRRPSAHSSAEGVGFRQVRNLSGGYSH